MYSKNFLTAICALALCASCVRLPWQDAPEATEVNLAFTIEKNLLVISTASIQGHRGRFVFGSAEPRTVLDATFARSLAASGALAVQLSEKESVTFTPLVA